MSRPLPISAAKTSVRISPRDAKNTLSYRQHYGLPVGVGKFDFWTTLYRVVDEREMALILKSQRVTGGHWAVPAERHWGASWGANLDEVVKFGLGWGERGAARQRLKGELFVLEIDGNGKEFLHVDPVRMMGLKEDPWKQELADDLVIDTDVSFCSTGLGCSVKDVALRDIETVYHLDRDTKVLKRVPLAGVKKFLDWKKQGGDEADGFGSWNAFMAERRGRSASGTGNMAENMAREAPDVDPYYVRNVIREPNKKGYTYFRSSGSALVQLLLTPVAREDLEMKLKSGRGRRFPLAAKELKLALRPGRDKIEVTPPTAEFVREELEDSLRILNDPSFRNEPWVGYHRLAIETALDNIKRGRLAASGPASTVRQMALQAREEILAGGGPDLNEVWAIVTAAHHVLRAKQGKCPEDGCVVKRDGAWRVMSNKTGKLWPQTYESKKDAEDAIAAYHLRKKGVPPR